MLAVKNWTPRLFTSSPFQPIALSGSGQQHKCFWHKCASCCIILHYIAQITFSYANLQFTAWMWNSHCEFYLNQWASLVKCSLSHHPLQSEQCKRCSPLKQWNKFIVQTFKCNGIEGQSWQRGGCTIAPTGQSSPVLIGGCCQGNNAFLGNVHVGIKANG